MMAPMEQRYTGRYVSSSSPPGGTGVKSNVCDCLVVGLWSAVNNYTQQRAIRPKFQWQKNRVFYNHFEISDLDVWRSPEYRDYIEYIDKTGGIYYRRWGDAPIKTLAVTLFIPQNRTHQFQDIAYNHGR